MSGRRTVVTMDRLRRALVKPPPPPPPRPDWSRQLPVEQARLREFREFIAHIAPMGSPGYYFTQIEEYELQYLEAILLGQPGKPIHPDVLRYRPPAQERRTMRVNNRNIWWADHGRFSATLPRRDLPVWKESDPAENEIVSAISEGDYTWMSEAGQKAHGESRT